MTDNKEEKKILILETVEQVFGSSISIETKNLIYRLIAGA